MTGTVMARVVAGLSVAAGAAALVYASSPEFVPAEARAFEVATPDPVIGCPGQQTVPVGDVGAGGELGSAPTDRSFQLWAPANASPAGEGFLAQAAVGVQIERIGDGDIEGWSAVTCAQPRFDQWLVGGATTLGSSARLVLTNPSAAPTEATVTVYGALGQVEDSAVVPVAPGEQADRLLEGVALEQPSIVVRVEASGPGVVATLQDSRLNGFQPAGTSWVGASDLAEHLVVPAMGLGVAEATSTLRMLAPEGATVDLTLVSEQGVEAWSTGEALTLEPGEVTDIAVPAGSLGALEIDASAPVVAASMTSVPREVTEGLEGDIAADITWVPALTTGAREQTAVVPLDGARLAVYSPYGIRATFTDPDGNVVASAVMPARTVQWIDVDAPPGTVISTTDELSWAVVAVSDEGYVASASPVTLGAQELSAAVLTGAYPSVD